MGDFAVDRLDGGASSSAGGFANADDIQNIDARWSRVERWYPDLTQTPGLPSTLARFADTEVVLEPDGATFGGSIRMRAMTAGAGLVACVVSEDDDIDAATGGAPAGPASLGSITAEAGGEILVYFRVVDIDAANWLVAGFREGAGAFPFADTYSYRNVAAIGRTTVGTPTPLADLEAITTDAAGAIQRTPIVGAAVVGDVILASVSLVRGGASARLRLHNISTNTELADVTHETRVPSGARLCAGVIFNTGAGGGAVPNAIDIGTIAIGYPA